MIWNFGVDNIIDNLEKTRFWLVPIIGVWFIVYLFNTFAYKLTLNDIDHKIPFWNMFAVNLSSFALNYITPFVSLGGEAYRAVAYKDKIGTHESVSSAVLFNMLHTLSNFMFWVSGIICYIFILTDYSTYFTIMLISLTVLIVMISMLLLMHKNGIFGTVIHVLSKINLMSGLLKKYDSKIQSLLVIDEQIIDFYRHRKRDFYKALAWEYIARVVASLEIFFILNSISYEVTIFQAIYINAISSLIMNMTFFIPMELGTRETSMYLALGSIAGDPVLGVYVSVINRFREFFWIFIGLISFRIVAKPKPAIEKLEPLEG